MENQAEQVVQELIRAYAQFRRTNWKQTTIEGLRRSEILVLWCVKDGSQSAGPGLRVSDLSSRLNVAAPTVTQQMNELESRGYVEKNVDPDDRRVVRIGLTPKGEKALIISHEAFHEYFKGLVEYLGVEDSLKFAELMNKTATYFQKTNQDTP